MAGREKRRLGRRLTEALPGLDRGEIEELIGSSAKKIGETAIDNMTDEQVKMGMAALTMEYRKRSASQIVPVTFENFREAETARMFDGILFGTEGVNRFDHARDPVAIDDQIVIRSNRDTLYSAAIVDISNGATISLPDAGDRYMSMMVINESHYINKVFHGQGDHELTVEEFDTNYVCVVVRTFVDPNDPNDLEEVHTLQDQITLEAASAQPFEHPLYDEDSRKVTGDALLVLNDGSSDGSHTFGTKEAVDPVKHLLGTAAGWGGLPENEAFYAIDTRPMDLARYTMTFKDVPVDGFWSVSIYNSDGFFEENEYDSYGLNSATAVADVDGTVTLNLSPDGQGLDNHLFIMDGWNYTVRLYRPRPEIVDGTWKIPKPELVD